MNTYDAMVVIVGLPVVLGGVCRRMVCPSPGGLRRNCVLNRGSLEAAEKSAPDCGQSSVEATQ